MHHNLNLNWLRTFEASARHLSFTAASKELGMTQSAVSLQVKSLETKLGQNLFIRRPKSLKLTDIAKAYLPSVRDSLLALDLSTTGLFGPDRTTTIVVRTSMALIVWLAPRLHEFQALYPNSNVKFVTAMWVDTVDTQNIDVDIILAHDSRADNHMEKLSDEYLVPICGLDTCKTIESINDLIEHSPIHILGYDDHWSRYLAEFNLSHDVRSTRLQVDTFVAACEFVACELGCAVVLERFATNAIETGRAIKCTGERVPLGQSHYLIDRATRKEAHSMAQAFKDWLRPLLATKSEVEVRS